jgi:hypothetical protein
MSVFTGDMSRAMRVTLRLEVRATGYGINIISPEMVSVLLFGVVEGGEWGGDESGAG